MPVIQINNVTKEYKLGQLTSFKDSLRRGWAHLCRQPVPERKPFHALEDITFTVEKGEVVGIIGTNGAGKSTLLKLISGITKPTIGQIVVKGKIAPLIEVSAGLHPELTGRENVFLNASILGVSKSVIKKKLDGIISFAELDEFIDTPVKRYSSGMQVRLGFGIATSLDADILIIDEVLAVGDLAFQRKCFDRIEEVIKQKGMTVIVVSHNIRQIERLSSRVIMLNNGKIFAEGKPKDVCEKFYLHSNEKIAIQNAERKKSVMKILSTGEVILNSLKLYDNRGKETSKLVSGSRMTIRGEFESKFKFHNVEILYGFHTTDMVYIATMGTAHLKNENSLEVGKNIVDCEITELPLVAGTYALRVCIYDKIRQKLFDGETLMIFTVLPKDIPISKQSGLGLINIPACWRFKKDI